MAIPVRGYKDALIVSENICRMMNMVMFNQIIDEVQFSFGAKFIADLRIAPYPRLSVLQTDEVGHTHSRKCPCKTQECVHLEGRMHTCGELG